MDLDALAATIAEHVNGMNKAQYILLALALQKVGGSVSFTGEEMAQASISPLRTLGIAVEEGRITLQLGEAQDPTVLN